VKVYQHTEAETRIRVAISQMPYGGLQAISSVAGKVGIRDGSPGPVDLEDVGAYLEALSKTLGRIAAEQRADAAELRQLKNDVAGMRRLLGIDQRTCPR
jgi:hypothetical protein